MGGMALARRPVADAMYPADDDMGEHELQRLISELLRPLLARFLASQGRVAHVGADQFIYWEEGNPAKRCAPDVYVLAGVDPDIAIPSWKIWETGIAPSLVVEVASTDFRKDYDDMPALYSEMGAKELVVFDPHATATSRVRRRLQVFRRIVRRGLVRVDVSQRDRVFSKQAGAWLRVVGAGDKARLRIAVGADGDDLFPTEAEDERAGRIAAEREVERLRALLEASGKPRPPKTRR